MGIAARVALRGLRRGVQEDTEAAGSHREGEIPATSPAPCTGRSAGALRETSDAAGCLVQRRGHHIDGAGRIIQRLVERFRGFG